MTCGVWVKEPFASADSLPMSPEVLQDVKMPEVVVLRVRFAICSPCLESLQLVVNEVSWSDLSSAGYNVKYDVKRNGSERSDGESANDRGSVGASHAVN